MGSFSKIFKALGRKTTTTNFWRHCPKQVWCSISYPRATLFTNSFLTGPPLARISAFIFLSFFPLLCGKTTQQRESSHNTVSKHAMHIQAALQRHCAQILGFRQKRPKKRNSAGRCAGLCFFNFLQTPIKLTRGYDHSCLEERFKRVGRIFLVIFFFDRWGSLVRRVNDRSKLVAGLPTEQTEIFPTFSLSGFFGACPFFCYHFPLTPPSFSPGFLFETVPARRSEPQRLFNF